VLKSARKHPNQIAMDCDLGLLTYGKLPQLIMHLTHKLARSTGSPSRSLRCAVLAGERAIYPLSMLAIHMAGYVYLPVDIKTPAKRILSCFTAAEVNIVLADKEGLHRLSELGQLDGIDVIEIDGAELFAAHAQEAMRTATVEFGIDVDVDVDVEAQHIAKDADEQTAVILFTSGSTGAPKGVQLAHRGYRNWYECVSQIISVSSCDRIAFTASPAFDIAIGEILLAFSSGATLCVAELGVLRDPKGLARWIETKTISILQSVPSLLKLLVRFAREDGTLGSLRILISTGEQLECALVRQIRESFPSFTGRIVNLYGPVEASIQVSYCWADAYANLTSTHVPIGEPFAECGLFLNAVQADGCGELIISGTQLAQGYLNKQMTDEKFFAQDGADGKVLCYRTGDVGYINEAGHIVLVGRMDDQIKLNGYRIELGEIESALLSINGISEACALIIDGAMAKELHAFVVASEGDTNHIRQQLALILPAYMLPRSINAIAHLPINQNGKRDKAALKAFIAEKV